MSRTTRDRRALFAGEPPPRADRDHHCHVLGCYGQTQAERRGMGEPRMKPSDQRRSEAATHE